MSATKQQKIGFKDYIAQQLIGKKIHLKCECLMPFEMDNCKIVGYELNNNEIVFLVDNGGKIVKIGENHPKLFMIDDYLIGSNTLS